MDFMGSCKTCRLGASHGKVGNRGRRFCRKVNLLHDWSAHAVRTYRRSNRFNQTKATITSYHLLIPFFVSSSW